MLELAGGWSGFLSLMYRYTTSMITTRSIVNQCVAKFASIYAMQDDGQAFRDVADLWKQLGLFPYTQETLAKTLEERTRILGFKTVSKSFIDELVAGIIRTPSG